MKGDRRNARALLGFMDEQEGFNFLKGNCVLEGKSDDDLRSLWRKARASVEAIHARDLRPEILELDESFKRHLDQVSKNPVFPEAIGQSKWSFKLVEIDKLVCFQKHVYTGFTEEMAEKVDFDDPAALVELSLPVKPAKKQVAQTMDVQQNTYNVFAPNMDLRILGMTQYIDPATQRRSFGFAVGFGLRFIQVVKFENRYFLKNGYHRVYMLQKNGVKHVACVLIDGASFADTGAGRPGFFQAELLMSDRPPVFSDFLSDGISPPIEMKPTTKIVRVRAEEFVLPVETAMPPSKPEQVTPAMRMEMKAEVDQTRFEDFRIEKEDWSVYNVSDGTILKLRQLLTRLRKGPGMEPSETTFQVELSNLLMTAFPPSNLKGTPSQEQPSMEVLNASIVEKNMKYETVRNVTNEYVTSSGVRLKLRLGSLVVSKTNKFDAAGEPRYVVNVQTNMEFIPPT